MRTLLTALFVLSFALVGAASPPPNPPAPPFVAGYLPIVLVNNSGLPDSSINIVLTGKDPSNTSVQQFIQFATPSNGIGAAVNAVSGQNSSNYSQPLSAFPVTGSNHVIYVPFIDSCLVWFSINSALNMPVNASNAIVQPNFLSTGDPNYNTIFDIFEFAYLSTPTQLSADATAVSFFSIPLYGYVSTPDPNTHANTGLYQSRNAIMSSISSYFATAPNASQWNNLFLTNGPTTLRLVSPGKGMTNSTPLMDPNYLDDTGLFGYSYIQNIWSGPSSFYRTNPLKLTIPAGSGQTYTGVINGDNSITFTSSPSGYQVVFPPPTTTIPTTTQTIFQGNPLYTTDTSGLGDGVQVSKLFEEAIIAGIVPTATTLSNPYLLSNQANFYKVNTNLSAQGQTTGPWYDLYSQALHAQGFIYTFAYDEPLWPQVQISSQNVTPNTTYLGITVGPIATSEQATSSSVTTSVDPSLPGQSVSFKTTVTGNGSTPTGTVTFVIDGDVQAPVSLVNGTATFSTSSLSNGPHTINAIYNGDSNNLSSSGSNFIQTVSIVLPPNNLRAVKERNKFASQVEIVNVLQWQGPLAGAQPVVYKIYRDQQLTKFVGSVPGGSNPGSVYTYQDPGVQKGVTYTYYVVGVDANGNVSPPAVISI